LVRKRSWVQVPSAALLWILKRESVARACQPWHF